jgi:hypothetical protein
VAAGEVDGIVRARYRDTTADDMAAAAAEMNAAGCDAGDLVVSMLAFPEQIMELNQFLDGRPSLLLVDGHLRIDEACLTRPWRHVFMVVVDDRAIQGELIEARFADRFDERRSLDLPNLSWSWLAARPADPAR